MSFLWRIVLATRCLVPPSFSRTSEVAGGILKVRQTKLKDIPRKGSCESSRSSCSTGVLNGQSWPVGMGFVNSFRQARSAKMSTP